VGQFEKAEPVLSLRENFADRKAGQCHEHTDSRTADSDANSRSTTDTKTKTKPKAKTRAKDAATATGRRARYWAQRIANDFKLDLLPGYEES